MFRWITEVQSYDSVAEEGEEGGFNYLRRLAEFVDGGLRDWSFVHGVSGIVTQGCHSPPCVEGAEFVGASRKATFIKTLRLLGLKVVDDVVNRGGMPDGAVSGSRRLGSSVDAAYVE